VEVRLTPEQLREGMDELAVPRIHNVPVRRPHDEGDARQEHPVIEDGL
jgi:hypothetical protein